MTQEAALCEVVTYVWNGVEEFGVARPQLVQRTTIEAAQRGMSRLNSLLDDPANHKQLTQGGGVWSNLWFLRGLILGTGNDGPAAAAAGLRDASAAAVEVATAMMQGHKPVGFFETATASEIMGKALKTTQWERLRGIHASAEGADVLLKSSISLAMDAKKLVSPTAPMQRLLSDRVTLLAGQNLVMFAKGGTKSNLPEAMVVGAATRGVEMLREILAASPSNEEAWFWLADGQKTAGDADGSTATYQMVAETFGEACARCDEKGKACCTERVGGVVKVMAEHAARQKQENSEL